MSLFKFFIKSSTMLSYYCALLIKHALPSHLNYTNITQLNE